MREGENGGDSERHHNCDLHIERLSCFVFGLERAEVTKDGGRGVSRMRSCRCMRRGGREVVERVHRQFCERLHVTHIYVY
jgi:hypothetical protein